MKKVVKIMLIILSFISLIFLALTIRLMYIHKERLTLEQDILDSEKKVTEIKEKSDELDTEITNLKESKKEKWEELEIWEKAKNKLKSATS